VGDLYASPNRTPTAAARAKTLALQQAQRDEATLKEKLEQQFYKQKAEQRRAATLQRNLAAHFEGVQKNNENRVKFKCLRAPPPVGSPDSESELSCEESVSSSSDHPVGSRNHKDDCEGSVVEMDPRQHIQHLELKPYNHFPHNHNNNKNQQQQQDGLKGDSRAHASSHKEHNDHDIFIETFDVMLSDVKGPLGKRSGGLRRYFKKLLDIFVSTGCIYRTANKIGICVHGTDEVLDIVKKVLDHAMKKPISPLHAASSRSGGGGREPPISWKYHSTGRTVRHGTWGKYFATRLCEKAQRGKYSPRSTNEKTE
jgi:hypothetical protein